MNRLLSFLLGVLLLTPVLYLMWDVAPEVVICLGVLGLTVSGMYFIGRAIDE